MHPHANNPTAVLWPRRLRGGTRTKGMPSVATLDWAEPCDFDGLHAKVLRPALAAVGLEGTRLHDLRHTFAALQLSAGVHFMQVSKWLGHASYTLTLDVYGEWIPEEVAPNTLPEPVAPAAPSTNVVPLHRTI